MSKTKVKLTVAGKTAFEGTGEEFDEAVSRASELPSNTDVKNYLKRAGGLMDDIEPLKEDLKQLKKDAKNDGIDMKAFNAALKQIRKPIDQDLKTLTNLYLEKAGQYQLFAQP